MTRGTCDSRRISRDLQTRSQSPSDWECCACRARRAFPALNSPSPSDVVMTGSAILAVKSSNWERISVESSFVEGKWKQRIDERTAEGKETVILSSSHSRVRDKESRDSPRNCLTPGVKRQDVHKMSISNFVLFLCR